MFSWFDMLTHPLLVASTLATLFMSLSCAMLGALLFVKKSSLLGETLSHAAYPGVVLGLIISLVVSVDSSVIRFVYMLVFGIIFVFLGERIVKKIESNPKYSSDMAFSVVLAAFFALGVFFSSIIQYKWPSHFSTIPIFLFGQLATLTDLHAIVSAGFFILVVIWLILSYRQIEVVLFDQSFSTNVGISFRQFEMIFTLLISLAIVLGIRSLGAILISGMFIAPAIGARILTKKLSHFIVMCALLALMSTLIGIYCSLNLPTMMGLRGVFLPTGPVVLLSSAFLSCLCLIIAPKRGLMGRVWRGVLFNWKCNEENVLKTVWKIEKKSQVNVYSLRQKISISLIYLWVLLFILKVKGKVVFHGKGHLGLTKLGSRDASNIVRVHRLWELYLVSCLGVGKDKVHEIAEEIEHVSTSELEKRLTLILKNPLKDPHNQPIPKEEVLYESL